MTCYLRIKVKAMRAALKAKALDDEDIPDVDDGPSIATPDQQVDINIFKSVTSGINHLLNIVNIESVCEDDYVNNGMLDNPIQPSPELLALLNNINEDHLRALAANLEAANQMMYAANAGMGLDRDSAEDNYNEGMNMPVNGLQQDIAESLSFIKYQIEQLDDSIVDEDENSEYIHKDDLMILEKYLNTALAQVTVGKMESVNEQALNQPQAPTQSSGSNNNSQVTQPQLVAPIQNNSKVPTTNANTVNAATMPFPRQNV